MFRDICANCFIKGPMVNSLCERCQAIIEPVIIQRVIEESELFDQVPSYIERYKKEKEKDLK